MSERMGLEPEGLPPNPVGVVVLLWAFVLAPYFNVGIALNTGMLALLVIGLVSPTGVARVSKEWWWYGYVTLFVFVGLYSAWVSALYGFVHLVSIKLMLSVPLYMTFGYVYGSWFAMRGVVWDLAFTRTLTVILGIVLMNSAIIIVSFFVPEFKFHVERLLVDATNINYKMQTWRLRGLASGGGAALSVLHGLGVVIALHLFARDQLGVRAMLGSALLIAAAMVFIGRTGFVVMGTGTLLWVLINIRGIRTTNIVKVAALAAIASIVLYQFVNALVPAQLGEYAFGYLLDGWQGVVREGTIGTLQDELFWPASPMHVLLGIGNGSTSNVLRVNPDPGYMKSLLSFGLPLAMLVYAAVVYFMLPMLTARETRGLIGPVVLVLLFVEVKEPFFYSGYSARVLLLLGGMHAAYSSFIRGTTRSSLSEQALIRP